MVISKNINPALWGKPGWEFMHWITLAYPNNPTEEEKNEMKMYFTSVGPVLPCFTCKKHFKQHLQKFPLDDYVLSCHRNLVEWLMNIHNKVNIMHGKKVYDLDMLYEEYLGTGRKSYEWLFWLVLVLVALVALMWFIFRKYSLWKNFVSNVYGTNTSLKMKVSLNNNFT